MRAPGTGAAARILLALAGAVMIGLGTSAAPAAAGSSSPAPSGTATVRGVLLHGDPGTPVGGSKVTLHGVADGADPLTLAATTDAKGRFVFGSLAGGDRWSYTVTAQSDGTQFSTDALAVKAAETLTTTLATYDVTTDPNALTRSEWLVWLDVEGSTLAVQQDVSERNAGKTAYTGSTPVDGAPDGGKAAVTLPVVTGATSLSYLGSFEVCCDAVSGTTWVHTRPVPPGTSTGTLRYEAPATDTLTFPVTTTTQAFTLLVPTGTSVTSPQLAPSGTQTDRGITYQVLKGGPFPTGTTITVSLAGAGGGSSTALVVGRVVVGLALVGVVVWLLRRRSAGRAAAAAPARPSSKPAPKGKAPAPAKQTKPTKPAAKPVKPAAPASSKPAVPTKPAPKQAAPAAARRADDPDVLADELAMLDLAHESGSLPDEASYQRVRAALVERLVDAVGDDPDALSR